MNNGIIPFIRKFLLYLIIAVIVLTSSCNNAKQSDATYQPVFTADTSHKNILTLGFPNFSNAETAESLIKFLNAQLTGVQIKAEASVNWKEFRMQLKQNKYDMVITNGIVACEGTNNGYSIVAKVTHDEDYTGLIFVRKTAGIKNIKDLTGKTVALVSSNEIPGTMLPLYYLHQRGIDVNQDISQVPVASFEAVILSSYLGKSDAGMILKRNWNVYVREHPEMLDKLEVKWETEPLQQNALLVKNNINVNFLAQVLKAFYSADSSMAGKEALRKLDIKGFEQASKETYKTTMDFKHNYDSLMNQ